MMPWLKRFLERLDLLIHSIRFRLALWVVLILGLVMAAFSTFIFITQARELRADAINRLESKSDGLDHFLHDTIQQSLANPDNQSSNDPLNFLVQDGDVVALFGPDGTVLRNWGPIAVQDIPKLAKASLGQNQEGIFFDQIPSNDTSHPSVDYVFMVAPVLVDNKLSGFFLIGSQIDPAGRLDSLMLRLILGGLATLVLALVGGFWLADRAMRPVKTITQTARELSETDLSRRLHIKGKDEIGQLASTFDDMLVRLEAAFERQRRFTADASHELRTPLTIVNLETSRALSAPRSQEEYQRAMQVIHAENDFMTRLVKDLLTLARMDAGQAVLAKEPLDLSDVALEAVERLSPLASRQGVELNAGDLPEVRIQGDRQYLIQMLTNLIENAIKYTTRNQDSGLKRVTIETGIDQNGDSGWVRVSDTGAGIPAEHLPHLFDRFYRVDEARVRDQAAKGENDSQPSGSGLGLAIVQWIARLHGGNVEVQSELKHGSTFTVAFPLIHP
jgi:two-component system OmpR family sensor kinase